MGEFEVIVIGGGIAGLVAAGIAAEGGARVLLLEAAPAFGGRARTRIVSGYHFNQGAHALYRGGFFDHVLRDFGVDVTGSAPAIAAGYFVRNDTLYRAPFSAAGLAATTLLSDAEKRDMASLLRRAASGSTDTPPGMPLQDALASLSSAVTIRAILEAMTRLTSLVHAPLMADGAALLDQLRGGLTRNVLYLDGGWGPMIDGLSAACAARGVSLRASARVSALELGDPWRVTLADGTSVTARAVVLAVNPAQAASLRPGCEILYDAVPAKVACLDIGLATLPRPDILFALGVDRPLYMSVHSVAARLAPEGTALIHTVRYLDPDEKPDGNRLLAELERFLDVTQPGWRAHERVRQFLPAMPAISAIPMAASGGMNGRPGIAVPNEPGLFIAGDWVGSAGMLADAAAASGRAAGEAAAAYAHDQ